MNWFHSAHLASGDVADRRFIVVITLTEGRGRVFVKDVAKDSVTASIPAEPASSWGSMLTLLGVPDWLGDAVAEGVRLLTADPSAGPAPDDAGLAPDASSTSSPDQPRTSPEYPAPGSEIPDQPGFVVGVCGHRLAGSEWRAGFRTCERCHIDDVDDVDEWDLPSAGPAPDDAGLASETAGRTSSRPTSD